MRKYKLLAILLFWGTLVYAGGIGGIGGPGNLPSNTIDNTSSGIPIDGGISTIVIGLLGYGAHKARKRAKEQKGEE